MDELGQALIQGCAFIAQKVEGALHRLGCMGDLLGKGLRMILGIPAATSGMMLYCDHSSCVNFDWLRLCQIDPPRQPSQPGMVFLVRTASLRFCFVSQSQNSHNLSGRSIYH